MPRMIELIRNSAVPANMMRQAAHGALALPPSEMIEILVYLSGHSIFGEQARMTLAGWDEASSLAAAKDPNTPQEVLSYMIAPDNRRPRLLPALIENPSVPESTLAEMGLTASREVVDIMLDSGRVCRSPAVLHALAVNPHLEEQEISQVKSLLQLAEASAPAPSAPVAPPADASGEDEELLKYQREHAAEIAAEEGKAFELVGGLSDEDAAVENAQAGPAPPPAAAPAAPAAVAVKAPAKGGDRERISVLQKISRLSVGERVQLAMKGNKEERFILIRDGSKVVSSAVLESSKLTDSEVEMFASMKNVQESVLRGIAGKRKFMKNYAVIRQLANNPRCPLDIQLPLINHLLVMDLKNLSMNKNISDTIRKMALKMFKTKSAGGKKGD